MAAVAGVAVEHHDGRCSWWRRVIPDTDLEPVLGGGGLGMIRVAIPSQLRSYTGGKSEVAAEGETVAAVLADLDRRFPGIRFRVVDEQDRIRQHMRIFVNQDRAHDLAPGLRDGDEVMIFGALTGGQGEEP